jgi:hypothetical protein
MAPSLTEHWAPARPGMRSRCATHDRQVRGSGDDALAGDGARDRVLVQVAEPPGVHPLEPRELRHLY